MRAWDGWDLAYRMWRQWTVSRVPAAPPTRVPWQAKYAALSGIWGASFLFMMIGLRALQPVQIAGGRILAGTATLTLLSLARGTALPTARRTWAHVNVTGFFLCSLPFTLFALSEERITAALAGMANATTPIGAVILAALALPGQRPGPRQFAAVLVGFAGVLVILSPWQDAGRPDPVGFGMALLAGFSYAIGWTWAKRFLTAVDPGGTSLPTAQLLCASGQMIVVSLVWWLTHRDTMAAPWSTTSGDLLAPLLCVATLGVVGTGLAQAMQYDVVRAAGPTVATTVTYLIPVVSTALSVTVLGEHVAVSHLIGALIVVAAAVAIGWPSRRPAPAAQAR